MSWKRCRFKTYAEDERPLIFNPKFVWWCTGYGEKNEEDYSIIVAYLPSNEDLLQYWSDAFDIDFREEEKIEFSERFPKPDYFKD